MQVGDADYRDLLKAVAYEQAKLSTSAFFLDGQEQLRLRTFGSLAGAVLACEWRLLDAKGVTIGNANPHTPNSDRTVATTLYNVGEGFLLNVQIRATSGTPRIGQIFAILDLVRGTGSTVQPLATLWSGYVTDTTPCGWPGVVPMRSTDGPGVIRSITGTDPAAGLEISETVPTNARWSLLALRAALVTDGTVANRVAQLTLDDGTTVFDVSPWTSNHTAGLTFQYNWAQGYGSTVAGASSNLGLSLPRDMRLMGGFRIRTVTAAIVAGDNWGAPQLLVEEWIED